MVMEVPTVNVTGGVPPYYIQWNDPYNQTTVTAYHLSKGTYTVTVTDSYYCQKTDTVIIKYSDGVSLLNNDAFINIFPSLTSGIVNINISLVMPEHLNIDIYNLQGKCIYSDTYYITAKTSKQIDLSKL